MEKVQGNSIQLKNVSVSLTERGYYIIEISDGTEVDLPLVKEVVKSMAILQSDKKLPVLIISHSYSLPTEETRLFLAEKDSSPFASAEAYVIHSMAQKIVGNFYLKFNKPQRPTRLFNDKEEALEWLKQYEAK